MSASLVRKALDDTEFATEGKLEQLSKVAKKKFKPKNKNSKKKLTPEQTLKQNLKILQALEYKKPSAKKQPAAVSNSNVSTSFVNSNKKNKKSKKGKQDSSNSVFTEEDFEKFEKEYFVS